MKTLTVTSTGVEKEPLSEFYEGEERRPDLEWIYPFDTKGNSVRHNPRERMLLLHGLESKHARVKIIDMYNLFQQKELEKAGAFSQLENDTNKALKKEKKRSEPKEDNIYSSA